MSVQHSALNESKRPIFFCAAYYEDIHITTCFTDIRVTGNIPTRKGPNIYIYILFPIPALFCSGEWIITETSTEADLPVILGSNETPRRAHVDARLVHTTVPKLHLVSLLHTTSGAWGRT